ncbi:hypothetical protein N24_0197 [Corynebacterium suranareeae]|uniref:DUF202 domain-containing protein n=1 Tax=Corynebacterium suranareeae TaxID=2506452 RepID=A0A160PLE4_9CORY|nr:DUF202 domain-containing protein [Corynebacterium suranareeae]BAU94459.1 hypothetical protein N24_0197 [Corynebacterium suranareeae]
MRFHDDPGLQPERTVLAWNRTTVSMAVCSAILLRWTNFYGVFTLLPVVLLSAMAIVILFTQRVRYERQAVGLVDNKLPPNIIGVVSLTATLLIFGVVGIVFVFID